MAAQAVGHVARIAQLGAAGREEKEFRSVQRREAERRCVEREPASRRDALRRNRHRLSAARGDAPAARAHGAGRGVAQFHVKARVARGGDFAEDERVCHRQERRFARHERCAKDHVGIRRVLMHLHGKDIRAADQRTRGDRQGRRKNRARDVGRGRRGVGDGPAGQVHTQHFGAIEVEDRAVIQQVLERERGAFLGLGKSEGLAEVMRGRAGGERGREHPAGAAGGRGQRRHTSRRETGDRGHRQRLRPHREVIEPARPVFVRLVAAEIRTAAHSPAPRRWSASRRPRHCGSR